MDSVGHHYTTTEERAISITVTLKNSDDVTAWTDTTPALCPFAPTHFNNPWKLTIPSTYSGAPLASFLGGVANEVTINFDPTTRISGEAIYDARPYYAPDFCTD